MTEHAHLRTPKTVLSFIDGQWIVPTEQLAGTVDDPNTGLARQSQVATERTDVERAISAATALHTSGKLESLGSEARVALLSRFADYLDESSKDIGYEDAMTSGMAIRQASLVASFLGSRARSAGQQMLEVGEVEQLSGDARPVQLLRRPIGPVAVLAPWNAPTFVAVARVAGALAAGCPVILKPSEWAPGGCQIVAEGLAQALEDLDFPPAAFQLVHGAAGVGAQLASDPRVRAISFTGGVAGGQAVAAAAAPHFTAIQLELGGHNPVVVLEDADVELTATSLIDGMKKLNGQWCEGPGKVLVDESRHDELVKVLRAKMGTIRVGHCLDETTDIGPISHKRHRDLLQGRIDALVAAGGEAITSGPVPDLGGWFIAPTVVVGTSAQQSMSELFGPVISVHPVQSEEEAIAAAVGPETGLAGFVFSNDIDRAMRVAKLIPAGEVRINGCKMADLADGSEQSFWNNAGVGGHGPSDMVHFFQNRQTIGQDDQTLAM
ncbi:MAG: hypothetical protein QOH68_361 [Nocardioidaceae bacterium]|jgi:phenylacetaldehyde dehydrogenase|nr:hypothetical protein [Nocardioidaceae bacterium]